MVLSKSHCLGVHRQHENQKTCRLPLLLLNRKAPLPAACNNMNKDVSLTCSVPNSIKLYSFSYISNKMQHYTVYLFLESFSTCFGWSFRPSSGAHTTVFKVSGTFQTVTATCGYCGRAGTGLSVVWGLC